MAKALNIKKEIKALENTTPPNKIAKNTTFLTIASIIQKILSFSYFAYLAGHILGNSGVEKTDNLGKYVWALSFTAIFALIIEFGLGPVLTREVARDNSRAKKYLSNVLGIKLILTAIVLFLIVVSINLLNRPQITELLVYIISISVVLDSFTFSFYAILRAFQNLKYEAIGLVIYEVLIVTFGVISLRLGLPLFFLALALVTGSLFNFIFSWSMVLRKGRVKPRVNFDFKLIKMILKIALPFAIFGIFYKINVSIDSVFLGILQKDTFVGWYSVPSKITYALTFIPGAFTASFFPVMSYYYIYSKEHLAHIFEKAMYYLMAVSLPIAVGVFILSTKIILRVWGPIFENSILPLQILMSALLFVFLNYPVGNLLNACNRQVINMINMGVATCLNVLLNLLLIPKYGYIGAAVAFLVTAIVLVNLGLPWVNKIIKYSKKLLWVNFFKALSASLIMGFLLFLLRDKLSLFFLIPLGMVIYLALLYLVRGYTKKEVLGLVKSIVNRNSV